MERRVNVRGVVCDEDGKVFAVKHRDRKDDTESKYWATFGGGLDARESLHDGLVRESVEETGIVPKIGRLLFIQQFIAYHRDGRTTEKMELFFSCRKHRRLQATNRLKLHITRSRISSC